MSLDKIKRFKNRTEAGTVLARELAAYAGQGEAVLLALPRGGVPVAAAMASELRLALDILIVRKLGFPGNDEFAMGAVASGGACVLQTDILKAFSIPGSVIEAAERREMAEVERREQFYRRIRPELPLQKRIVILVDDGMATGSTMQVAVQVVQLAHPARLIVAVPVSSREAVEEIGKMVDRCICLITPEPFRSVGAWYDRFEQVGDKEVARLLGSAAIPQATP